MQPLRPRHLSFVKRQGLEFEQESDFFPTGYAQKSTKPTCQRRIAWVTAGLAQMLSHEIKRKEAIVVEM